MFLDLNSRIYVWDEDMWNAKGRYKDAYDDEEATWVKEDDKYIVRILAVGLLILVSTLMHSYFYWFRKLKLKTLSLYQSNLWSQHVIRHPFLLVFLPSWILKLALLLVLLNLQAKLNSWLC